jgi:hypothetical protein
MAEGIEVYAHPTLNPDSIKFATSRTLSQKSLSFADAQAATADALAKKIFDVPGVQRIFVANNAITVARQDGADWKEIVPRVMQVIQQHFVNDEGD